MTVGDESHQHSDILRPRAARYGFQNRERNLCIDGRGALAEQEIHISHNIILAIHQEKVLFYICDYQINKRKFQKKRETTTTMRASLFSDWITNGNLVFSAELISTT